jgi:hypothetical protein
MPKGKKRRKGPTPRLEDIKRAQEMLGKGLTYSQVSWAILKREDTKTIWRWAQYDLGELKKELSTGGDLHIGE